MSMQKIIEEFEKQFGKDGKEKNCDSIGRKAGCDDCPECIEIREEHKQFLIQAITKALNEQKQEILSIIENMPTEFPELESDAYDEAYCDAKDYLLSKIK